MSLRESRVLENCMHGLSGGRWPASGKPDAPPPTRHPCAGKLHARFERRTVASIGETRCATSDPTPMNYSNKIEQSMAESEEGRPLIKENIHQSGTRPTQSGTRVSPGAGGCAESEFLIACRQSSEIRAVCANERSYRSVRGAISNDRPYRDLSDKCQQSHGRVVAFSYTCRFLSSLRTRGRFNRTTQ